MMSECGFEGGNSVFHYFQPSGVGQFSAIGYNRQDRDDFTDDGRAFWHRNMLHFQKKQQKYQSFV